MIKSLLLDTVEIVLCLYAVIRYCLEKTTPFTHFAKYQGSKIILVGLCITLSLVGLFALIVLLIPLAIYKKIVDLILSHKHKNDYGGLLEGIDAMWAVETNESKHIINCLLFLKLNKSSDEIMPIVKKIYNDTIVYQFTSVRKRSLGYYYRLKNQVGIEDLIKELKLSDEERKKKYLFEKALANLSNSPMPKNDAASFELLVSTKPIEFTCDSDKDQKTLYPLLMRIHHTVGDGISLLSFLLKNLADEKICVEEEIVEKVKSVKEYVQSTRKSTDYNLTATLIYELENYARIVYTKLKKIANINIYHFPPSMPPDCNILHGPELSGEKVLAYYIENQPGYVSKIKSIKKRIPGTTFTDIVLTAVSASFWEYFKQNSKEIPEKIFLSFIIRPIEKNLEYIVSEQNGQKEVKLGNKFSTGALGLPINIVAKNSSTVLRERLLRVKEESEKLKNAVDILVYYWQLRFLTNLLPAPVLKLIIDLNQRSTVSFSNLPGIRGVHIQNHKLQDILFWTPNLGKIGVGLSMLTYDGRFQIGLISDKVLIPTGEKAHDILDNIIKYIDLIDNELNIKNN